VRDAIQNYRESLDLLRRYLSAQGDRGWAEKVQGWLAELDGMLAQCDNRRALVAHALRTKLATSGENSLGDLYLCAEAGHSVATKDLIPTNEQLVRLVDRVYQAADDVLARLG
jgi:hypothetical protein